MSNFIINPYAFGADYVADAVDFDGTNDYLSRTAALSGVADGKEAIVSFWINLQGSNGSFLRVLHGDDSNTRIDRTSGDRFDFRFFNAARTTTRLSIQSESTYTTASGWVHVLASWDMATAGARWLYINDADDISVTTFTNDTLNYDVTDFHVGARADTQIDKLDAYLFDFYINFDTHLDLSVEANRRKFIDASGKPVDLGADGSRPTGAQPAVFLHVDDGGAASDFATNDGDGGAFTENGALAIAASSPTD